MVSTLSLENPLFASYAFHGLLLLLKLISMSLWTVRHRLKNKALPAPEDYIDHNLKDHKYSEKGHPDVERIRRAHLNDLENILPFLLIGFLFVLSEPNPRVAEWFFCIFTVVRFVHTIVYVNGIGHRLRGISFLTGMFITISMCVMSLMSYAKHMHFFH